jgi:hypothetical protein
MRAYLIIAPSGKIVQTGIVNPADWEKSAPRAPHLSRYEISHETKAFIDGEGADRFFASAGPDEAEPVGADLSGTITIRRKQVIELKAPKTELSIGEAVVVTHGASIPIKLWSGRRPVRGLHQGKVHPDIGHSFGARSPGTYVIRVRDPRYWAEPLELRVDLPSGQTAVQHLLDDDTRPKSPGSVVEE